MHHFTFFNLDTGNTDGMTCKDIGDITLITKGTLTGVVDRLEEKGLVERWSVEGDGRKTIVALTKQGDKVYASEFPKHVDFLKEKFGKLGVRDRKQAIALLALDRASAEIVCMAPDMEQLHVMDQRKP